MSSGGYLHLLDFRVVVHEQILLPFGSRLGVVAKQYVIETETKKLLRCQQRHASLLGSSITFSLITFHARRDEIRRCAFTALSAGKNVIKREVFRVTMIPAVLAAISVSHQDLHPEVPGRMPPLAHVDVGDEAYDARAGEFETR